MYIRINEKGIYHYIVQYKEKWWHSWKSDSSYIYWTDAVNRENELIGQTKRT